MNQGKKCQEGPSSARRLFVQEHTGPRWDMVQTELAVPRVSPFACSRSSSPQGGCRESPGDNSGAVLRPQHCPRLVEANGYRRYRRD